MTIVRREDLPERVAQLAYPDHLLKSDPPANALSGVQRWTCVQCNSSVLQAPNGHVYGSATEYSCEEADK